MRSARLQLLRSASNKPRRANLARRQQVAAVCFRILSTGIEFLLVRTRRSRWTFPKGGIQRGLTHAQSAAIEAYEEAGVHGRIEEAAFARYGVRKGKSMPDEAQVSVHAHLCEVLRLAEPEEFNRNPTWFSPAKAKRRLAEGRTAEDSADLARIIERAVSRIRRFPGRALVGNDPLLKIKFEAGEFHIPGQDSWRTQSSIRHNRARPSVPPANGQSRTGKLLELRLPHLDRH